MPGTFVYNKHILFKLFLKLSCLCGLYYLVDKSTLAVLSCYWELLVIIFYRTAAPHKQEAGRLLRYINHMVHKAEEESWGVVTEEGTEDLPCRGREADFPTRYKERPVGVAVGYYVEEEFVRFLLVSALIASYDVKKGRRWRKYIPMIKVCDTLVEWKHIVYSNLGAFLVRGVIYRKSLDPVDNLGGTCVYSVNIMA